MKLSKPVKRTILGSLLVPRTLSSPIRMLPDFLIIGTKRGGTTSMYNYLTAHPCIAPAFQKEPHFFDMNFKRGVNWYRAQFPSRLYQNFIEQYYGRSLITGEATPCYLFFHYHAVKRVVEFLPKIKIIALLRNPIDRAYSHYYHEVSRGNETLSFEDAIQKEDKRTQGEWEKVLSDSNYYSYNLFHYSYLSRGIYIDQIRSWVETFTKNQILVLKSEDLYDNPVGVYKRVISFLGLPDFELKNAKQWNETKYQNEMAPKTRRWLSDHFRHYNNQLYEYLGMDFNWE